MEMFLSRERDLHRETCKSFCFPAPHSIFLPSRFPDVAISRRGYAVAYHRTAIHGDTRKPVKLANQQCLMTRNNVAPGCSGSFILREPRETKERGREIGGVSDSRFYAIRRRRSSRKSSNASPLGHGVIIPQLFHVSFVSLSRYFVYFCFHCSSVANFRDIELIMERKLDTFCILLGKIFLQL